MFSIHYTSLFYFGEVSFKNLILSDICGVGYGSLRIALETQHNAFPSANRSETL
ncbi:hypothetical protein LEP1GSC021_2772 [Leptospira noguchii str. 1993005606]|uniref:Uncharacterized protein n=1 Tax=Leptospira noguchii str. 2007001578 TaxID=1049974 RepID=A0ABP2T8B0_9LEPT|nr:hypothetical protein LEP1GSC035_2234 [Leptospira noguchii str. 2007001578]EPE84258.1 hypothetical protein LEP1GSC021_2772 [Leptospira noguchii str. 1993005606]